jgi:hypothetical protein
MKPIFICGTGRSGTTILKRVLSRHSKVISLRMELRVIVDPDGALDLISALSDRWSPYNADAAIHRFRSLMLACARTNLFERAEKKVAWSLGVSLRRYIGIGHARCFGVPYYYRRLDQLIQELCHHVTRGCWDGSPDYNLQSKLFEAGPMTREYAERIIARFFQDLYANFDAKGGQTHWVDDTPYNLLHAHELLQLFPGSRAIHVYRDPRDVVASHRRFGWGGDDYVAISRRVSGIYSRWFEIREQLPTDLFLEVGLEELAADPTGGLIKICEFTGLDFEKDLIIGGLLDEDKVHAGRWKNDISKGDWERAEPFIRSFVEAYGYEVE